MITRISRGGVNCYLLSDNESSILIDTCNAKDGEAVLARVRDHNIRLILLTHAHCDHIGAADYLREHLGAPIAIHAGDLPLLEDPALNKLHGHTLLGSVLASASMTTLKKNPRAAFTPDLILEDGFSLEGYGVHGMVISLPGHTRGSVGVLTPEGDFIVGDAMFNTLRPTPARLYENRMVMENSVLRIRRSGATMIYPGHGKPFPQKSEL